MNRKKAAPVYKEYVMHQDQLLPMSYDEKIEAGHLVRVVNEAIEKLDLHVLLKEYKGGGTSSYHPKMMLKILVYGYCRKIYTSRKIAAAVRENIHFMWLSGGNEPDFRTINDFRGSRMKGVIDEVFKEVLEQLLEAGYVKLENYFVDGTKIEADANKHKMVWGKSRETYEKRVKEKIEKLLDEIETENKAEQTEYGEKDLEERGDKGGGKGGAAIDSEKLKERIEALNEKLRGQNLPEEEAKSKAEQAEEEKDPEERGGKDGGKGGAAIDSEKLKERIEALNEKLRGQNLPEEETKAKEKALKELEKDCLPRLEKYEQQAETLAGRSSYSHTDPDASAMRMKEDRGEEKPWPKPAYNVQIGTEGQFIVGFSVHGFAGDTTCLPPHLERLQQSLNGRFPKNIIADAAYGSEENYAYLAKHGLANYLKYNTFFQDTHHFRDPNIVRAYQFRAEHFEYDAERDEFICPAKKRLLFQYASKYTTVNGYTADRRNYECHDCADCPFKPQCTKAQGNRQIRISFALREYRKQARENLTSPVGEKLRAARSTEVETVFGHLKHNMGFRRFHLRGAEKVKTEWGILSIAHNLRKMAA